MLMVKDMVAPYRVDVLHFYEFKVSGFDLRMMMDACWNGHQY